MLNFFLARQLIGTFALNCAMNGIGVATITLTVVLWNASRA
jgi:hypothetical protein